MDIKAVLFDVDGTLVVSEPVSQLSVRELYRRDYGICLPEDAIVEFVGNSDDYIFATLNSRLGVVADIAFQKARRADIYDEYSKDIATVPGAVDFIKSCKAKGLKVALATSATPRHLEDNLKVLGLDASFFDFVINGDMVENAKPDSDIYLAAAAGVGCKPSECLVIEDAVNGHMSARAAGCPSIGILGSFSEAEQKAAGALYAVADFTLIG